MIHCRTQIGPTLGFFALAAVVTVSACGGSGSPKATATGGAGGVGNEGGASGNAGAGPVAVFECEHYAAPGELITDFSNWSSGNWGDDTTLTGGSFYYDSDSTDGVDMLVATVTDGALGITGDVVSYAGFGLWFGPCLDASQFDGIEFTISGDFGESGLEFQVQTSRNYPIDTANSKGACAGEWSNGCVSNTFSPTIESSETPTKLQIAWADLTGGDPIAPIDPTELLGLQWQFNCASDATCTPNVVIDDVKFYTAG